MSDKNSDQLLRKDLEHIIKTTSKNDIISKLDRLYSSGVSSNISTNLIKDPVYLAKIPVSKKSLAETKAKILQNKPNSPIIIRKINNNYEVIVGRRRLKAYKELNIDNINCVVSDMSDEDAVFMTLSNSLEKQYKNIREIGFILKYLNIKFKYSLTELSNFVSLSVPQISNYIRITELPEPILNDISNDIISFGQAKVLCSVDSSLIYEVESIIKDKKLSIKETEKLILSYSKSKKEILEESNLCKTLGAKELVIKKKSIEIFFSNNKDLQAFIRKTKKQVK